MTATKVQAERVSKVYVTRQGPMIAVQDLSLEMGHQHFVCLLGREVGAHDGIVVVDRRATDCPRYLWLGALLATSSAAKRQQELRAVRFDRAG